MNSNFKLIGFDMDGTLTPSRGVIDKLNAKLVGDLTRKYKVVIISGGAFKEISAQVLSQLPSFTNWFNLHILPTCGGSHLYYQNQWLIDYEEIIELSEVGRLTAKLNDIIYSLKVSAKVLPYYDYRKSQLTLSLLPPFTNRDVKMGFDPEGVIRRELIESIREHEPRYEFRIGGSVSIDITKTGIDKGSSLLRLSEQLGFVKEDILYFGERFEIDGNDYPVKKLGIKSIEVADQVECFEKCSFLLQDLSA
jgi:HAD superfamily hydrolase (TIGR01484 family)